MVEIRLALTGYIRQGLRPKCIISYKQQTFKAVYESLQFQTLILYKKVLFLQELGISRWNLDSTVRNFQAAMSFKTW